MGWSVPSFESPSTVVISAPSAIGANSVQDFTVRPFKITVHAPQYVVSQPMCVPVRLRCSRRNSTRSVRGSTSASRASPLTRTRTITFLTSDIFMPCFHLFTARAACGDADGALDERRHQRAFVLRGTPHIALRFRSSPRGFRGSPNILLAKRLSAHRCFRFLGADGGEAHATENHARILARVVAFQSELHRSAPGWIYRRTALKSKMRTSAPIRRHFHVNPSNDFVVRENRGVRVLDKRFERHGALATGAKADHRGIKRQQRRALIAAGI